jgi:aspartate-semialdehyde dehydrogenase
LAVNVETKKDFDLSELREAIGGFPGISLQDDPKSSLYPQGLRADGKDPVFVGRVRRDTSLKHGFNFWIVSDNLRKGAALNGVQIAEELLHRRLL